MKILYTCDLHGRQNLYDEMFRFALANTCECIIIGGDLFPTRLAKPIKLISGGVDFNESLSVQIDFIDSYLVPVLGKFMRKHPDVRILYVPGNHDWKTARDVCSDIGYALLEQMTAEQNWSDLRRKGSALGFSGLQGRLVFEHRVPKTTLTLLWCRGTWNGRPWEPLFTPSEDAP